MHYIRDTVFGEDKCRVRKEVLPGVPAALSNLALSILRLLRVREIVRFSDLPQVRPQEARALAGA